MAPFQLLYGYDPSIRDGPTRDESHWGRVPAAEERARTMRDTHATLAERWREAAEAQKKGQSSR